MSEHILEIKNLSHKYGKKWAIKDISFDIQTNGVLGLLGSNGAGKSTTINILCGVISATKGKVFINGMDAKRNQLETKKQIGFLPQKAPLYPDLTVDEYLNHCARFRLIPKREIRDAIARVKNLCNLNDYSNTLLRNLSGGYQQRVGIAQAIVHNPKLIVLDEPTNGLDPVQILQVRELIKEIAKDKAVLLSTHILSEVQATCDRIIMIEGGDMVFSGGIKEFNDYTKPRFLTIGLDLSLTDFDLSELEVPGVEKVFVDKDKIRVETSDTNEVSKRIVEKSVEKKWGLNEIFIERNSLNDVFAELSKSKKEKVQ